jgi:hypothetical protein
MIVTLAIGTSKEAFFLRSDDRHHWTLGEPAFPGGKSQPSIAHRTVRTSWQLPATGSELPCIEVQISTSGNKS